MFVYWYGGGRNLDASIAQLGERQTEDLKVPGSIPGRGTFSPFCCVWSATSIGWVDDEFESDCGLCAACLCCV